VIGSLSYPGLGKALVYEAKEKLLLEENKICATESHYNGPRFKAFFYVSLQSTHMLNFLHVRLSSIQYSNLLPPPPA
jgi:hypothetical protein